MVPRQEQWIRAERLANLGWITTVKPDELDSGRLSAWMHAAQVPQPFANGVDLLGLNRISQRVGQWAANRSHVTL